MRSVTFSLILGDALSLLRASADASVQCVVTSPPYWGLRDYGIEPSVWGGVSICVHDWTSERLELEMRRGINLTASTASTRGGGKKIATVPNVDVERAWCNACGAWLGCLGLEPTPELYIEHMVMIFREVRRVMRDDGTLWLNIGDSYSGSGRGGYAGGKSGLEGSNVGPDNSRLARQKQHDRNPSSFRRDRADTGGFRHKDAGLKAKDLVGIPWMLAFALRADGWYLRSEIIWSKPNPMPESVTDRPTKAHETIFLLSKSARYFYDADAIAEPSNGFSKMPDGWDTNPGAHGSFHRDGREKGKRSLGSKGTTAPADDAQSGGARMGRGAGWRDDPANTPATRNKRSVWTIATQPFPEAHFATFPEEIPRTCILAGSRPGDVVLDPFNGAGTTGVAALALGRNYVGIDLNPEYIEMSRRRLESVAPMFARETAG
jgi:DNA modification methylase